MLGVKFLVGPGETRPKVSQNKIAEEFAEKSAGDFPNIRQTKLEDSPPIRSAEPRGQHQPYQGRFSGQGGLCNFLHYRIGFELMM